MEEYHQHYHGQHNTTTNGATKKKSNKKTESRLEYLRVKISSGNARSIRLFESVGFQKVSEAPNYFGEVELRMPVSAGYVSKIERGLDAVPLVVEYA
jgi:L-amino acid N-acyltransferase YncA